MTTIKLLGLDYGVKRVGVALSLAEEGPGGYRNTPMVFPRPAILRTTRQEFFERLLDLIEEERPAAIVLGLPLCRGGLDSLTTRQVRNFAASLGRRCTLPIYFMDEALSSSEAESRMRESGLVDLRGSREAGLIDSQAAVGILESFLNLAPETQVRVE